MDESAGCVCMSVRVRMCVCWEQRRAGLELGEMGAWEESEASPTPQPPALPPVGRTKSLAQSATFGRIHKPHLHSWPCAALGTALTLLPLWRPPGWVGVSVHRRCEQ